MFIYTEKVAGRQRNRPLKDYSGMKFGRLTAVELVGRDPKWAGHKWLFTCDCGEKYVGSIKQVRSGHTSSCGCLFREHMQARNTRHGLSSSAKAEYRSWKDMRRRCMSPRSQDYPDYGGRGIKVCERWNDFAAFLADMGPRPRGATIDRMDVNGDYEPDNCRWANAVQQANNKRSNHLITYRGQTRTLAQWCREFGIEHSKARYRLSRGWSLDDVFKPGDSRGRA